jgi:hypothetical protein
MITSVTVSGLELAPDEIKWLVTVSATFKFKQGGSNAEDRRSLGNGQKEQGPARPSKVLLEAAVDFNRNLRGPMATENP